MEQMGSEIIIVPFIFSTIGFVVWVAFNAWQRRQQVRSLTDFNTRLLERMQEPPALFERMSRACQATSTSPTTSCRRAI